MLVGGDPMRRNLDLWLRVLVETPTHWHVRGDPTGDPLDGVRELPKSECCVLREEDGLTAFRVWGRAEELAWQIVMKS
jgi:hypothetical protein